MPRFRFAASCFLYVFTFAIFFWGQAGTSALRGTVSDAKGAVIAGANITLTNDSTGFSRTLISDEQGSYQFLQVPPAAYVVTVSAPGFSKLKRSGVVLQVSSTASLNLTLKVEGATTTVEVTGEAPVVNTVDASLGNNFNSRQLLDIPSEGRDPASILSLQPGVVYIGKETHDVQDYDSRGGAVNGARSDQTNITLDGLDDNDQINGYAFEGAMRATLDSLQEFKVTTSNYDADAGRSSGAQVDLVTKSGTNALHGSLYEYHRPTFTAANDWFNKQAELRQGEANRPGMVLRNTFGGSLGGPIKKDRLFFFAAYEGQRTADAEQITREVPSASLRAGELSYLCDPTSDPNCTTNNPNVTVSSNPNFAPDLVATITPADIGHLDTHCTANGTCPLGRGANPLVANIGGANPTAIFNRYPLPNSDSEGDGLNIRAFTFPGADPVKHDTYIVRLDYKLTANGNHSLFIRGGLQNDHESQPPQFPGQISNTFVTDNSKGIFVGYTALLSSNFVNNFRYGFVRQGTGQGGLNSQDYVTFRGLDDSQGFTPTILSNVPVSNFVDDVSWTKGKHTIEFGTNWRLIHNNRESNAQNVSFAETNLYWLNPSFISGTGGSLDPGNAYGTNHGYPGVDPSFGTSYDFAAVAVTGILAQTYSVFNQDKAGNAIASGALIPRHFKSFEGEMYLQDKWRVRPDLVVTYGLRYTLLQPPYETSGNQVAPTIDMHDWFNNRWRGMLAGVADQPLLSFAPSGQANGGKPYWNWDYKDFAPRFAIAYSPHADEGFWHKVFGQSGKSSIRAGYGMYYDHFGEGVVNTFDRQGSWGLTSSFSNPAGVTSVDDAPRFTGLTGSDNLPPSQISPAPHGFPYTPPSDPNTYGLAIGWGLDNHLKTPYSHVVDFSITRELPNNFVFETSYTGRFGHRLLQEIDLAQPLNLYDPASKTSYYQAADQLAKLAAANTPIKNVPNMPYWQDLFPQAAGHGLLSGNTPTTPCSPGPAPASPSSTQNIYDSYFCNAGNETLALELMDAFCFPAAAGSGTGACGAGTGGSNLFQYYQPQFGSLYAWQSRGNSNYNGLQVTLRRAMTKGLQFDANYVYSKSIDVGSNAERVNGYEAAQGVAFNDQIINAWSPNQWRAVSDYDTTHQFNANWIAELPYGQGRRWGGASNRFLNGVFGGWSLTGSARVTSGFPFTVFAGTGWSSNFELEGSSVLIGPKPKTGTFISRNGDPTVFQNPQNLSLGTDFRATYPGEAGQRNNFRGPGYFEIDSGLDKTWKFGETKTLTFFWETFNLTNSVRFDAGNSLPNEDLVDITEFGKYQRTLTSPRVMQFALHYGF